MKILSGNLLFIVALMFSVALSGYAQNPGKHIREGNELYEKNDFAKAETNYLKALEVDTGYIPGQFNRADALYEQGNYEQAAKIFQSLTDAQINEQDKAAVWHNLGNSFLEAKQYPKAVSSYKNALRKNPEDLDTKYNLTYALEKLKDEQQNQQKNQQNNQDKKQDKQQDKNKDKQQDNQDKNQKDKQKKENQNQDQDKKKNEQKPSQKEEGDQQKQPEPRKISKDEARRMLEALKNNEKETLKNLKRIKAKGQKVDVEKDW